MKEVKSILLIFVIILFVSSYKICDLFYYNDEVKNIKLWWGLKSNLYTAMIALIFYASSIDTKGVVKLILSIGVGLAVSNVIDKVFFNVLDFRYNDVIMIVLTIGFSTLNFINEIQGNARTDE